MYSVAFPNIFESSHTHMLSGHEATVNNLRLLLLSDKMSLLGDPYYGTNIKRLLQSQTRPLKEIVIEDIYKAIVVFMPQLKIKRENIDIKVEYNKIVVELRATNILDKTTDLYQIRLNSTEW